VRTRLPDLLVLFDISSIGLQFYDKANFFAFSAPLVMPLGFGSGGRLSRPDPPIDLPLYSWLKQLSAGMLLA